MVVEPVKQPGKEVRYKYVTATVIPNLVGRIGMAAKTNVIPFGPFVPSPALFKPTEETRAWILSKCRPQWMF